MKNDLPNQPEHADPLDALLHDADEYIPDNGFTARVVQNLPARRSRRGRRFTVLAAALLIGVVLAAWQSPALVAFFSGLLKPPAAMNWRTVLGFVPLLAALGSLVWVGLALANEED